MTDIYAYQEINPKTNKCKSYTFNNTWNVETETHSSIALDAGNIASNAIDLTLFADALFRKNL